jgi:hypothetical protein
MAGLAIGIIRGQADSHKLAPESIPSLLEVEERQASL